MMEEFEWLLPRPPKDMHELLDRAAIADVIYGYAHAIDRRDWAVYRAIFSNRVDIDFMTWAGIKQTYAAEDWVAAVRSTLAGFDATQHTFTNLAIVLAGDVAQCRVNMTARHQLTVDGTSEAQILGGYYTYHLARQPEGWRITGCTLIITWEEGDRRLFETAKSLGSRARVDVGMQGA